MKLTRIAALGGGLAALILGATLAPGALAQQPVTGTTQGSAGGGVGNASVFNLADLKTNGEAGALICTGSPATSCNYDDNPAPNTNNRFVVAPNLDDSPMQWANKYVFINNPSGVLEVQKTISAVLVGGGFTTVYDDRQPGANIHTGQACLDLLGSDTTVGSVANGLITTGQKTAAELQSVRNGCQQNTVGILVNPFPVSKHLPPGVYRQCAVLAQTGGATTAPFCEYFFVQPITGFTTDVDVINYGALVQNTRSIFAGNFTLEPNGTGPDTNPGTIMGIGNTSPMLLVAYSCMANDYNLTPGQITDDKQICKYFDVQLNRRDAAGNIIATARIDHMLGGAHPASTNPFGSDYNTTNGTASPATSEAPIFTTTGAAPFLPICLEPNEEIKLDFSVTPQEVLYTGTYTGRVRLTVTNTGSPCTPTLGTGESATGDADSVNNNLPGTPVAQTAP